jgi:mannan endo-1,4-beta-mannosidase
MTWPDTRVTARRPGRRRTTRTRTYALLAACAAVVIGVGVALAVTQPWKSTPPRPGSVRYLGVYEPDAPSSYAGIDQFAQAIGRQPNMVSYYSRWKVPFQAGFAAEAAKHGAVTVVQIDPLGVSLASIAAGQYDGYLRSYAAAVRAFGGQVVLSFGHEMNGNWYSWGYQHTAAKDFVAAWRHIVTVFRAQGATNATWLWTVNVVDADPYIPTPGPWWPGSSYVNWVGIDGYYDLPSQNFSQVFGPTIAAVRGLTSSAPILLSETGVAPWAGQPSKINDLFAGIQTYGLSGFILFDENTQGKVWRLDTAGAFGALRQDARSYMRPPAPLASP